MSDKHYVGLDLTGFEDNGKTRPISRITLNVDDNNVITAGDDTGLELVADCPHATQEMADAILKRMKGYQYQMFTADAANIDPAAELGDGVTAGGVYGVISRLSDDGRGYPDITAPGEAEMEDEFPIGGGPMTQAFNRQLSQTRSLITKTAEEIRLEITREVDGLSSSFTAQLDSLTGRVDGLDGQFGEFKLTVDGFTVTGPDGTTRIKGSSIETGSIAAGAIKADQIQLSGAISWGDLSDSCKQTIDGMIPPQVTLPGYIHSSYIGATEIISPTIKTNLLTVTVPDGGSGISGLSLQGYVQGQQYEMLRITCSDTYVTFNSPAGGTLRFTGSVSFTSATVMGLHMTFTA